MSGVYFIWSFFIFPFQGGLFGVIRHGREKGLANSTDCIFIMTRQKGSVVQSIIRGFIEEGLTIRVTATVQTERGSRAVPRFPSLPRSSQQPLQPM